MRRFLCTSRVQAAATVVLLVLAAQAANAGPSINPGGVVNAASYAPPVAPGSIATIFGRELAPAAVSALVLPLPASLGGVTVQLNGFQAPLFYVSPTQINFQVPSDLAGQAQAAVSVTVNEVTSAPQNIALAPSSPGLFAADATGRGQGAVLIAGGSALAAAVRTAPGARPVTPGETISIFCTGLGAVPVVPASLPLSAPAVTVTLGGVPATVTYSGPAPGFAGLDQVNAQVAAGTPAGDAVPLVITAGDVSSNIVTISTGTAGELPVTTFSGYYAPVAADAPASVPSYRLPVDLNAVANWGLLTQANYTRYFDLARIRTLLEAERLWGYRPEGGLPFSATPRRHHRALPVVQGTWDPAFRYHRHAASPLPHPVRRNLERSRGA